DNRSAMRPVGLISKASSGIVCRMAAVALSGLKRYFPSDNRSAMHPVGLISKASSGMICRMVATALSGLQR
ncbi:TPA: hypothetical protein ACG0T3_003517, partial [Citrobacter farmeri]